MLVLWSSVLACSKVKQEGDPKTLSYDHDCPDVPAGVTCPSGSGDNTTTTPNGSIVTNQFLYGTTTSYGAGKMYWGLYKA